MDANPDPDFYLMQIRMGIQNRILIGADACRMRIQVTRMIRILADLDTDAEPDPQHCTYPHQSDKLLDLEPDTDPHQFAN